MGLFTEAFVTLSEEQRAPSSKLWCQIKSDSSKFYSFSPSLSFHNPFWSFSAFKLSSVEMPRSQWKPHQTSILKLWAFLIKKFGFEWKGEERLWADAGDKWLKRNDNQFNFLSPDCACFIISGSIAWIIFWCSSFTACADTKQLIFIEKSRRSSRNKNQLWLALDHHHGP